MKQHAHAPFRLSAQDQRPDIYYQAVFISDLHLGAPIVGSGLNAAFLVEMLEHIQCEKLYMVGDIIDLEVMDLQKRRHIQEQHKQVIDSIHHKRSAYSTECIYKRGNHDDTIIPLVGNSVEGIQVADKSIYAAPDGRRFLVVHGDKHDQGLQGLHKWPKALHPFGDTAYRNGLKFIDTFGRAARVPAKRLAMQGIEGMFGLHKGVEPGVIAQARDLQCDGVIFGHTHRPKLETLDDGFIVANDGHWTDRKGTFIGIKENGEMELVPWSQRRKELGLSGDPDIAFAVARNKNAYRAQTDLFFDQVLEVGLPNHTVAAMPTQNRGRPSAYN